MKVRYLNVQNWTDDKNSALITHLTQDNPEVILFTSTSRTQNQGPIKIPFYNTFTTNKADERHAGSGIAIPSPPQRVPKPSPPSQSPYTITTTTESLHHHHPHRVPTHIHNLIHLFYFIFYSSIYLSYVRN